MNDDGPQERLERLVYELRGPMDSFFDGTVDDEHWICDFYDPAVRLWEWIKEGKR